MVRIRQHACQELKVLIDNSTPSLKWGGCRRQCSHGWYAPQNRCCGFVMITHSFCVTVYNQKWISSHGCAQQRESNGYTERPVLQKYAAIANKTTKMLPYKNHCTQKLGDVLVVVFPFLQCLFCCIIWIWQANLTSAVLAKSKNMLTVNCQPDFKINCRENMF